MAAQGKAYGEGLVASDPIGDEIGDDPVLSVAHLAEILPITDIDGAGRQPDELAGIALGVIDDHGDAIGQVGQGGDKGAGGIHIARHGTQLFGDAAERLASDFHIPADIGGERHCVSLDAVFEVVAGALVVEGEGNGRNPQSEGDEGGVKKTDKLTTGARAACGARWIGGRYRLARNIDALPKSRGC
jgi:hypothetical protein